MLEELSNKYDAEKLTIQSGGNLNVLFLRNNLLDYINIVIATLLVCGKDIPTLVNGKALVVQKNYKN